MSQLLTRKTAVTGDTLCLHIWSSRSVHSPLHASLCNKINQWTDKTWRTCKSNHGVLYGLFCRL